MTFYAYEMTLGADALPRPSIACSPLTESLFPIYKRVYNDCFRPMRQALALEPVDYFQSFDQIARDAKDIFLLTEGDALIGSVSCFGNELDGLIVAETFRGRGYGRQLLLWGVEHIRQRSGDPVTLHVAAWNRKAMRLYRSAGFRVSNIEKVVSE